MEPVVPGASERPFRGLRLKPLVSFGAGGVVEGERPLWASSLRSGWRWNASRALRWEWNSVCFGAGGARSGLLPGPVGGDYCLFLWLWMLELSAGL